MRNDRKTNETCEEAKKTEKTEKSGSRRNSRNSKNTAKRNNGKYTRSSSKTSVNGGTTGNDPAWYASNPQLMVDAGSYSFNNALGASITGVTPDTMYQPGIMTFKLRSTPGASTGSTSAVNIAAANIYSWVRHANSGHANYESSDYMMYLLAMGEVYSAHAWLARIYGIANTYSQVNRYIPRILLKAMGVDPDDVISNLANLRYAINNLAVKAGSMCVPATMPYFLRHVWMYSNIYADTPNMKAQLYAYVPDGFFLFTPVQETTGGSLTFTPLQTTSMTCAEAVDVVVTMLNAIITDEDMNIMSGDTLKAFGADNIFRIGTIPEDYAVVPVYNPEVLPQFQNITIWSASIDEGNWDITQVNNMLQFNPKYAATADGIFERIIGFDRLVTSPYDAPTPADVFVSTRLTCAGINVGASSGEEMTFGSEICVEANIYSNPNNVSGFDLSAPYISGNSLSYAGLSTGNVLSQITKFAFHPNVYLINVTDSGTMRNVCDIICDLSNYTTMDYSSLKKLHDTAMLSLFNVPQMGRWSDK